MSWAATASRCSHDFTDLTITSTATATAAVTKNHHGHAVGTAAVLTTTWHHPFWDATTRQWVDASHLTPGTHLREADGTFATVAAVRNYHTTQVTYDLTTADLHSYYVLAGTTPVLVHNCDPSFNSPMSAVNHCLKHAFGVARNKKANFSKIVSPTNPEFDGPNGFAECKQAASEVFSAK